jgi:hypothetical protein
MNHPLKLGTRFHLDCRIGEVGWPRGHEAISLSLPQFPVAESAILLVETPAFVSIVILFERLFASHLPRRSMCKRRARQGKQAG